MGIKSSEYRVAMAEKINARKFLCSIYCNMVVAAAVEI
jgi:hypothetical protein